VWSCSRAVRKNTAGGMPSRVKNPCIAKLSALRGCPASHTSTRRRHRPRNNAALNPAGPAPTIITSYITCLPFPFSQRNLWRDGSAGRAGLARCLQAFTHLAERWRDRSLRAHSEARGSPELMGLSVPLCEVEQIAHPEAEAVPR